MADVGKMFRWPARIMEQAMDGLAEEVVRVEVEGEKGEWMGMV
jgi:hypothetical protein